MRARAGTPLPRLGDRKRPRVAPSLRRPRHSGSSFVRSPPSGPCHIWHGPSSLTRGMHLVVCVRCGGGARGSAAGSHLGGRARARAAVVKPDSVTLSQSTGHFCGSRAAVGLFNPRKARSDSNVALTRVDTEAGMSPCRSSAPLFTLSPNAADATIQSSQSSKPKTASSWRSLSLCVCYRWLNQSRT